MKFTVIVGDITTTHADAMAAALMAQFIVRLGLNYWMNVKLLAAVLLAVQKLRKHINCQPNMLSMP